MQVKKNEQGYEQITLYEKEIKREDFYAGEALEVTYEKDKDQFNIFFWRAGDTVKKIYGDFDAEEWLFVKLKHGEELVRICCDFAGIKPPKGKYNYRHVFEVLHRIYAEDKDAFHKLKRLMERKKLPHKFDYYH